MSTMARKIAAWARDLTYEQLDDKTIHEVKRRVIDSIGCALGSYSAPPCKIARAKAMAINDTHAGRVLGTNHSTTAELAAFANGTGFRYLDYNDTYLSLEPAHPSDNLAAVIAVAQAADKSGKDAILAAVIGYEIQCRLCDAASLRAHGWDHVYYGALSCAVLSAKLWGLDEDQIEHALGLAGVCNIATRQTRTGQMSMWKGCAFANAARNGVFAADLARRGMTGPYEIFEGPKGVFNQLTGPFELVLGKTDDFMINNTYIKFWPAEYHSQSAIEAILALRPEIGDRTVESIHIGSFEAAVSIIGSEPEKWRPTSRETADHSMAYCVAVALLDGDVTLASFDDDRLVDPRILGMMDKTKITEQPELNEGYPKGIPNHLTVTLSDGSKLEKRIDYPRGHNLNPMTDDEVTAKFNRLAKGVLADGEAERVLEMCWGLEKMEHIAGLTEFKVIGNG
jgi:2-methylcitrate dehydratase